ncbi:MAG TPA: hypothetical protein VES62_00120 [Thermoleophilaceae bacterium]|nr:hypothetical protein [Thermoleophilaceae bacterium]
MSRTVLAFLAIVPVALAAVLIGEWLGLGSWARALLALGLFLPVTLIDREGFYGIDREHDAPHR